jgi:Flp pilus assembly protein TadG
VRDVRCFRALLKRLRGSTRGQGLVEFALVIPLVLLLFFGVFEFGRFFYSRLTLQHAVAEAARFAVTGNVLADTITGDPMTRAKSIISVIHRNASTLNIDVGRVTIYPSDAGGPGDVVRVSADFTFQLMIPGYTSLFPNGQLEFSVSTAMRNEPFITSESP